MSLIKIQFKCKHCEGIFDHTVRTLTQKVAKTVCFGCQTKRNRIIALKHSRKKQKERVDKVI